MNSVSMPKIFHSCKHHNKTAFTRAENLGGGAEGAIAPPLFTVFNRLLVILIIINNTNFIKSCLFHTDFS